MSSDSELSDNPHDDSKIEQTLRDIVKAGKIDSVTINNVRTAAEEELGLPQGFFKSTEWKTKSKDIISEAFVCGRPPNSPVPFNR